jgi:AraC-like DNA-binding protein
MAYRVFDTSVFSPARRFDAFYDAITAQVVRITPDPPRVADFRARVISRYDGSRGLHLIEAPGHAARRCREEIRSTDPDEIHLSYMAAGTRRVIAGGVDTVVAPGGVFVLETRQPFLLPETTGRYRAVKIALPRAEIVPRRGASLFRCPIELSAHPYAAILGQICNVLGEGLENDQDRDSHMLTGLAACLLAALARGDGMEAVVERRREVYALIDLEMEMNMGDPRFCLESLSQRLGVSARSVQRVLACHDTTFSDLLRKKRLDHASRRIRTSSICIEELAAESGYQELSAFYRAYRRQFGMAPGETRRAPR